ncbi:tRNA (guanosine(46)-N7)-methyltransferase TrmB [Spiroplasma cantharicola]|uniref:tRNA (guanine-N(7)-)-methyltransferase n=1 Tax=Spiroplasma cantharicola TaxID=362837 RepID=A0A0M5KE15_9MOLU|nr:tRNA (guanosine(46)-N7)-methyltransferase TrmB [Spiroplasma cantharicola]ALD65993.1 tRNA (guanine-N(7)-)-methyltransferase [Spiroplasma cantharicola]
MRLRNKNWTKNFIEENLKYLITTEEKINASKLFSKKQDTFLEIGCGKGQFIIEQAKNKSNKNFIAMEKETTVMGVALKKAINQENFDLKNLLFLNRFAENLLDIFERNSLKGIFLNFSDPWPKAKHFKKRLTYLKFLEIYWDLLADNGIIEIKTDNDQLYDFSLEQIKDSKFKIIYETNDLYSNKEFLKDNIQTEYEQKFYALGKKIKKIVIKKEV